MRDVDVFEHPPGHFGCNAPRRGEVLQRWFQLFREHLGESAKVSVFRALSDSPASWDAAVDGTSRNDLPAETCALAAVRTPSLLRRFKVQGPPPDASFTCSAHVTPFSSTSNSMPRPFVPGGSSRMREARPSSTSAMRIAVHQCSYRFPALSAAPPGKEVIAGGGGVGRDYF